MDTSTPATQPRGKPGYHYRWRCRTCHTARDFGVGVLQCELAAGRHARRNGSHVVDIEEYRVRHTFTGLSNMDALPLGSMGDDPPPF